MKNFDNFELDSKLKQMKTTHIGIFSNGHIIENISLQTIAGLENVTYILRKEWNGEGPPVTYTLIDKEGKEYLLQKGNFKVVHIGADDKWAGTDLREVTIEDTRLHQNHVIRTTSKGAAFFYNEILPLLDKLNEIGSWQMYEKLTELEACKKEIEKLRHQIKQLQRS